MTAWTGLYPVMSQTAMKERKAGCKGRIDHPDGAIGSFLEHP
ncbi:MAG TPA: hypothetical protein VKN36_04460 [Eudoraea sp.]|nr:hypothetical protein [Eudoraea sp.]